MEKLMPSLPRQLGRDLATPDDRCPGNGRRQLPPRRLNSAVAGRLGQRGDFGPANDLPPSFGSGAAA